MLERPILVLDCTIFGAGSSGFGAGKFGARSKIFGANRTFTFVHFRAKT